MKMNNKFKFAPTLGAAALAFAFMGAPAPANAAVCSAICGMNLAATQAGVLSILSAISYSTASIIQAVSFSTYNIITAIGSSTESMVGSGEKGNQGGKELEQAKLNYDAATKMADSYAKSMEQFVLPESQAYKKCVIMAQAQQAEVAGQAVRTSSKLGTYKAARRNMGGQNPEASMKNVLDDYKSNYCSKEDVARDRCTTAAPEYLQNASVRADILLTPAANETYSAEESKAADSFITMVSNPIPIQSLPANLEKTPGGNKYFLEQMYSTAQMSVGQHSLQAIKASKEPSSASGAVAAANGYSGDLSLKGVMSKFTEDKFGNPEYAKNLQTQNENGLLKEMNVQMAFNNWLGYKAYEQNERMEAIMAVQMLNSVRERSAKALSAARQNVGSLR